MNYKKSLISLVAAMALSTSAFADSNAIYVPMSNTAKDGLWTLIGVNGLSTGVASGYGQSTAGFSSGYDAFSDSNTTDYLEEMASNNLVSVQALQSAGLTGLDVGMPVSGVTFEKKEPVRSMYVKINSSTPNVKINYKASLEGVGVEFYINNDLNTRYVSTISQDSTYADAVDATLYDGSGNDADVLNTITDVLDFNSTDNPVEAKYFDASTDLNTTGESAIFYHFDAVSQQWKIWDKGLTGVANDFTEFTVGDAYWGQVDRGDAIVNPDTDGATALILGKSGNTVPSADTYRVDDTVAYNKSSNSRLSAGWNMIALDNIKPNVRHAATGLVITTKDVNATMVLSDSTGAHSISVDLLESTDGHEQATAINLAFEKAKIAGTIPPYFNVKAFGSLSTSPEDIILISDARFTIEDDRTTPADFIGAVTTLTGGKPYNNLGGNVVAITELDHNSSDAIGSQESATSAYGEYALVLNTLVGASSADTINGADGFAKIEFGDTTNGDHGAITTNAVAGGSTIALVTSELTGLATAATNANGFAPTVTAIDTDNNGTEDMVIVANGTPFYVKDKTYTRVFSVDASSVNGTSDEFTVLGATEETIIPATQATAATAATNIAAQISAVGISANTKVYAASSGDNIVAVSVEKGNFDLKDIESQTLDLLTNTSDSSDLAKGAIGSVHALDEIAKISLVPHIWTANGFSINADVNESTDTICVEIVSTIDGNGTMCTPINPLDINGTGASISNEDNNDTNVTARLAWFDAIVNDMTVQLTDGDLHGYAYHTYTTDADNLTTADVVLVSYDANLTSTTVDGNMSKPTTLFADSDDALTLGGDTVIGGKLTNDLTTNPVHTPDFASYGPLYTMYDAGYDVRAILKAETDLSAGDIIWDSIDLTRDEDDWFLNNEMNMFKTNLYSGYWVYLTALTAPEIVIGTPTYSSIYTYYFDKDGTDTTQDSTTNIVNGGSLTVNVTGINVDTSSVFAKIGGIEFEMKRSGTSDDYTADLTSYAVSGFAQDTSGPTAVTIRVTNGKGEYKKDDSFEYDFTPPTINAPTYPSITEVQFNTDETDTTFHIFKNYIPELASTRADATLTTLIATQASTTGSSIVNICKELTFGETPEIVAITADGDGAIGSVNLSDAETFTYAVMFKGAQVLSHSEASTDDKSIYGTIYDDNCTVETTAVNNTIAGNSGVSLKSLVANSTAYLSYAEKDVGSDLSQAYEQIWTIDSTEVIQVQSLDEYAGETFFVEYDSKLYTGTFPADGIQTNGTLTQVTSAVNTSLQ